MHPRLRSTALAFLLVLFPGLAGAQQGLEGVLNAVSYRPIPAGAVFEVRTLDNSDQNLVVVERMKQAMRLAGRGVQDDAQLLLTVEPRDEIGAWSTNDRRHVLSVTGDSGTGSDDETEVRVNLFDSTSGGVLNEGEPGTAIVTKSQYVLLVRIEDRTNGRQLWEAWAAVEVGSDGKEALLNSVIPRLVESIGTTVKNQTFSVR